MLIFDQLPLLELIFMELKQLSKNIRIIGRFRSKSNIPSTQFIPDLIKNSGPIGGLYTALKYFNKPVLLTSCDMPFLKMEHYKYFISQIDLSKDATIARSGKGIEPLLALYKPNVITEIERQVAKKTFAMHHLISKINVKFVDFSKAGYISNLFFNINTFSDYKKALYLREKI